MLDAKTLLSKIVTDPQALYVEVLIASMPDLTVSGELPAAE